MYRVAVVQQVCVAGVGQVYDRSALFLESSAFTGFYSESA